MTGLGLKRDRRWGNVWEGLTVKSAEFHLDLSTIYMAFGLFLYLEIRGFYNPVVIISFT